MRLRTVVPTIAVAFLVGGAIAAMGDGLQSPPPQVLLSMQNSWTQNQLFTNIVTGNTTATSDAFGSQIVDQFSGAGQAATGLFHYGGAYFVRLARASGTFASPTVSGSSDTIGGLEWRGYDGANFIQAASIESTVCGAVSTSIIPGCLRLYTWNASGVKTQAMLVGPDQSITWTGTSPTVTGTGTPTVTVGSNPTAGSVTAGLTATSVVITSGDAGYTTPPFCHVTPATQLVAFSAPVTVVAGHWVITVTQTATSGDLITYNCWKNT